MYYWVGNQVIADFVIRWYWQNPQSLGCKSNISNVFYIKIYYTNDIIFINIVTRLVHRDYIGLWNQSTGKCTRVEEDIYRERET